MRYLSVCSGIESATVAWHPLGWTPAAFAEIEPFPAAVLAHHWPTIPNLGDITKYESWPNIGPINLLVGGTPCQAFSVAGRRGGLNDARGNLALTFCEISDKYAPEWVLWENVPGVLSDRGNAFGCFLGRLCGADAAIQPGGRWPAAGVVSGPARTVAWRILDAQYFGVAQRRRRVFVLASPGPRNWRCAAALFPVSAGLPWDPKSGCKTREGVAAGTLRSTDGGSDDTGAAGHLVANTLSSAPPSQRNGGSNPTPGHFVTVANCLTQREGKGPDSDATTTLVCAFDTTQITSPGNVSAPKPGDPCHPLTAAGHAPAIAFEPRYFTRDNKTGGAPSDTVQISATGAAKAGDAAPCVAGVGVRRLTPMECERLQGFPDRHTLIPVRGKPAADGPRYKAVGNSMAVPVIRWIGQRIEFVNRNY